MMRWGVVAAAVALVAGLTTACQGPRSGDHTVVTSFYPLYFIAERVAGRYNDVVDLTPPGVEPHEYELTVRQVATIDLAPSTSARWSDLRGRCRDRGSSRPVTTRTPTSGRTRP